MDLKRITEKKKKDRGINNDVFRKLGALLKKDFTFLGSASFSDAQKEMFYTQLNMLISAGIDIPVSLDIVKEQFKKKKEIQLIDEIIKLVKNGESLSDSLRRNGKFSEYECQAVYIGEESGTLRRVLDQLKNYFKSRVKQKRKVVYALMYPLFVLSVTLLVVTFMLTYIVPMFQEIFSSFDGELPALTQFIIQISENIMSILVMLVAVIVIIALFRILFQNKIWYRLYSGKLLLKIPVIGLLSQKIYLSRFCQSMALLIKADIPLVSGLEMILKMIPFYPLQNALNNSIQSIHKGATFYESIKNDSIFEKKLVVMLRVAEEVNKLDDAFERMNEQYSDEIEHRLDMLNSLLEPLMILVVGIFVGIILISMYLPLFQLSTSVF